MAFWRPTVFWQKLCHLLPWKRRARELSLEEELRSHMEMAAQDALLEGASQQDATYAARRDLGSVLRASEGARCAWTFAAWERLKRDIAYSLRTLSHAPSFTLVAILSLGVGIGSATAIFSLLNAVLLKPLAYREPGRLLYLREIVTPLAGTYPNLPVNYQHFLFWRDHARSFESLSALQAGMVDLTGANPIKIDSAEVSTNLFSTLGVAPRIGRGFLPKESQKGRDHVVILTDSLWARRFGRAPDLIGHEIMLDYTPYTVVGILPPGFRFPRNDDLGPLTGLGKNTEVFLPLTESYSNDWSGDYDYPVIGRLSPHASMAQGVAEINNLERQIDAEHRLGEGLSVLAARLGDVLSAPVRTPLWVLMGASLLLLLIVCANLTSLVLARSSARNREYSIRVALGAGRTTLIHQVLVETSILALAGGLLGLVLAAAMMHAFTGAASVRIPRLDEVRIDAPVLLFSPLISIVCGLFAGLLPAFRITRGSNRDSLAAGSHTIAGNRYSLRTREILIGSEVAMSVVLLFGAGLMTASLARLLNLDKGFSAEQGITMQVSLPYAHYKTAAQYLSFWSRALERIRSVPGVESAAFTSKLPLTGESMVNGIVPDGASAEALDPVSRKLIEINVRYVSPEYFQTLGIPLLRGRLLQQSDRDRTVAVISGRLAAKVWPSQNPIGRTFTTGAEVGKAEVVGVVKDVHATTLDREPTLIAYVPYWHRPFGYGTLVVRTAADPGTLIPLLRSRIQQVDPSLPAPEVATIHELVATSLARRYFQVSLSGGFACAALALALMGIYGVVAYNAAQRRTDVAIRLALGASRGGIFRRLLEAGFRPVVIGMGIGVLAAFLMARFIQSLLFGVKTTDPLTMVLVLALLALATFCASIFPVRKAVETDPLIALRYE